MNRSETIGALAEALAKAQGAMANATKDRENPFFKSKYATLASIWDAIREPLSENGLAIVQTIEPGENNMMLVTSLMHASGEWINSIYPIAPVKFDPQGVGSALTYARRYGLSALVGQQADEDDDGNDASGTTDKPGKTTAKATTTKQTPPPAPDAKAELDSIPSAREEVKRPWSPAYVQFTLRRQAAKGSAELVEVKHRNRFNAGLANIGVPESARKAVMAYLFDKESSTLLTQGEEAAVKSWVDSQKQNNGEWVPNPMTVTEAAAIVALVMQPAQEVAA